MFLLFNDFIYSRGLDNLRLRHHFNWSLMSDNWHNWLNLRLHLNHWLDDYRLGRKQVKFDFDLGSWVDWLSYLLGFMEIVIVGWLII